MDIELFHKKYTPRNLLEIQHNENLVNTLKQLLVKKQEIPNLLFIGGHSFDSIRIVRAFLSSYYDNSVFDFKNVTINCDDCDVVVKKSQYHYEFDMNYHKFTKRDLIIKFIKEIAKTCNISTRKHNVIVVKNANIIIHKVQAALRRIMETCSKTTRFIFLTSSKNKIVEAVRSRCCELNIVKLDKSFLINYLKKIVKNEKIKISDRDLLKIVILNEYSIVKSLETLQVYQVNPEIIKTIHRNCPYREIYFYIKKLDIKYFEIIENLLYNLLLLDIPYSEIFKKILKYVIKDKHLTDTVKIKATSVTAKHDYRCLRGNKSIIHLNNYILELIEVILENNK